MSNKPLITKSSKETLPQQHTQPSSDFKTQFKKAKANLNYSGEDLLEQN